MTSREPFDEPLLSSLLQATLDATADGILVVDRNGVMTVFNSRFLELWRLPRERAWKPATTRRRSASVLDQLTDPRRSWPRIRELYDEPVAESCDVLEFRDGRVFERYSARSASTARSSAGSGASAT